MSYGLRNYRHRNPKTGDEKKSSNPFFKSSKGGPLQRKKEAAFFQPKLTIGQPGDIHEKEADAVANQVVQRLATSKEDEKIGTNDARMERDKEDPMKPVQTKENTEGVTVQTKAGMDDPKKRLQKAGAPDPKKKKKKGVQKAEDPKKKKKKVQKAEDPEKKKKKPVHKKEDGGGEVIRRKEANVASEAVSAEIMEASGKGSPLPAEIQAEMSRALGMDLGRVRIHHDAAAAKLCTELNAQAFTHGYDIFFNEGKYNPESAEGKRLLAHELTHVAQQNHPEH